VGVMVESSIVEPVRKILAGKFFLCTYFCSCYMLKFGSSAVS
jgi:hypothetical protein